MLSSVRNSSSIRTAFVIGAGVAAAGIGYMVYRYWGGRQVADADEGFVDETKVNMFVSCTLAAALAVVPRARRS